VTKFILVKWNSLDFMLLLFTFQNIAEVKTKLAHTRNVMRYVGC